MAASIMPEWFNGEADRLKRQGYQWAGDVYPVTYGLISPAGFAGKPDEKQRRFNRMVHLSKWPHDATKDEFSSELVVHIPGDSLWCHWLAFGEFSRQYLAMTPDDQILMTLARFHKIVSAYGCDRQEFYARMLIHNEQAYEEWLADYAERNGMFIESARYQVAEEREAIALSTGGVGAPPSTRDDEWEPRHPFSWYESRFDSYANEFDSVDRNYTQSFECIREKITTEKEGRERDRKAIDGLTIADMHAAEISYSDLGKTESYQIDHDTKEIIVIRTSTGKVLRRTGKYVARLLGKDVTAHNQIAYTRQKPVAITSKHDSSPKAEKPIQQHANVANEPENPAPKSKKRTYKRKATTKKQPEKTVVAEDKPQQDTSGWKGTRKRRSCVSKRNTHDAAVGCMAIGAMFARKG